MYFSGKFECPICLKHFPFFYLNHRADYWGDRGRYNFRGAKANFIRHIVFCCKKNKVHICIVCKSKGMVTKKRNLNFLRQEVIDENH